jgi:Protein of unknown function (DUF1493)
MFEQNDAWTKLVEFFELRVEKPVIGKNRFTRDTDLYHDLDMEPDEIERVLREWSAEFNVDTRDFDLGHYYPSSKLNRKEFFLTVLKALFSREARETLGGWQLTMGMLEEAMLKGKLVT